MVEQFRGDLTKAIQRWSACAFGSTGRVYEVQDRSSPWPSEGTWVAIQKVLYGTAQTELNGIDRLCHSAPGTQAGRPVVFRSEEIKGEVTIMMSRNTFF